ncbi:MAG TPA: glycosyltransferase family 1 protein [Rhodoblastus sp.]|nr:glycosyltransferase family 1 protein [Rhodoblastus sp.]
MTADVIERHTIACLTSELEALDNFLRGQGSVRVESEDSRPVIVTSSAAGRAFGFVEQRAKEFWWTATRLVGLGHMHDGTADAHPRLDARAVWNGPAAAPGGAPRILIDATRTHSSGLHTGVQRVTRKLAEFVAVSGEGTALVQAGKRIVRFFKGPWPDDVAFEQGDILLLADLPVMPAALDMIDRARRRGVYVILLVYDLIPILYPGLCAPHFRGYFKQTIDAALARVDGVIAISACVAQDVARYIADARIAVTNDFRIGWSHLGADFAAQDERKPPDDGADVAGGPFFLGVGTIEPRKAWNVALDAMERLWADGVDARLVLVGRYGWSAHWLRTRIESHPEFGKRLIWRDRADDAELAALYRRARALVYPSVCEGFGLPLIEARHYGAPVIASDIPVFREIAGDAVRYFPPLDDSALAALMRQALERRQPPPDFPTLDWARACAGMLQLARDMAAGRDHARRVA